MSPVAARKTGTRAQVSKERPGIGEAAMLGSHRATAASTIRPKGERAAEARSRQTSPRRAAIMSPITPSPSATASIDRPTTRTGTATPTSTIEMLRKLDRVNAATGTQRLSARFRA